MTVDDKNEGFDRVFDLVGGHGRFQWRLLLIISLQLIILTWHHIGYTFLGNVPDHWCLIDELKNSNWTTEQIKNISIPKLPTSDNPNGFEYDKCTQYYFNYDSLLQDSATFEEAFSKVNFQNATNTTCSKWEFDRSTFQATVSTEFELVCGRRGLAATIQGSYMAGGLLGTVFFGSVSDRFLGRQKTVFVSLTLVVVGGILTSFAKSYWLFVLLRFVISIGVSGSMQNCFVLVMEHSDKNYRALVGLLGQVPFAVGFMILPIYAYFLRDWSTLQLAFGISSITVISYRWILPDSPRWLATHGKEQEALECLLKIAKVNNYPEPSKEELLEIIRPCHEQHEIPEVNKKSKESEDNQNSLGASGFHLFKHKLEGALDNFRRLMITAEIRKRSLIFWTIFCTVSMVYYGLIFSPNLTSNIFLYTFFSGLMEIPAYTLVVPLVSKYGRRPTTATTFFLTGICMIGLSLTPAAYDSMRIILAMSAKLFISSAFGIIYVLGAELYPTEMRTTGLAVGIFMGRMGAISAPFIADLMQLISKDLPTIIFGISSLLAGVGALGLPETGKLEMVDQLYEIERQVAEEKLKEKRNSTVDATYL